MRQHWTTGLALTFLALSCNYSVQKKGGESVGISESALDAEWLTKNLFNAFCTSCHNGGRQPGGFKFETALDLSAAVRMGGIKPGSASESQIFQAIASGRMPPGSRKPTSEMLEVLRCWIDAGAAADSRQCAPSSSGNAEPQADAGSTDGTPGPGGTGNDDDDGDDDDDHEDDGNDSGDDDAGDDDTGDSDGNGSSDGGSTDGTGDDSADGTDGNNDGTGADGGTVPEGPTFSQVDNQILQVSCVACHGSESPSADVNLSSLVSITNPSVGPVLVTCGNAAESLLNKVIASDAMPMGSDPLSPALKKLMSDWINGGCKP